MYVSIYIMLLGLGLLFFSRVWFVVMLGLIPVWWVDCRIEEKQLIEIWGEKYEDYKKRTGMFLPKLSR